MEQDIEAAENSQQTPAAPAPVTHRPRDDDDDDDDHLVKDDDAQAAEDVGGLGGGGNTGPGLIGNEDADASEFSFENPEGPEVAPNTEADDCNEDDTATTTVSDSRSVTDEDRDDAGTQHYDLDYSDDVTVEDDDATQDLGRSFTDDDKDNAAVIRPDAVNVFTDNADSATAVTYSEDDTATTTLADSRTFTDDDIEDADGQNFDVDYSDDRDVPSGEDDTQNLGRSFTDEDREDADGQNFDVDYSDDRDVPSGEDDAQNTLQPGDITVSSLITKGETAPEGYVLVKLADGRLVYRRDPNADHPGRLMNVLDTISEGGDNAAQDLITGRRQRSE